MKRQVATLLAISLIFASGGGREYPDALGNGTSPERTKALYLLFAGDCAGIELVHAVRKQHEYAASPVSRGAGHRVRLFDRKNVELAAVSVDLSGYCLDPAHRGRPPHHDGGCITRSHRVAKFVSVPDLIATSRIVLERIEPDRTWKVVSATDGARLTELVSRRRFR